MMLAMQEPPRCWTNLNLVSHAFGIVETISYRYQGYILVITIYYMTSRDIAI